MELTKKELAYLELYKGIDEGIDYLKPEVDEGMRWFYAIDYNYQNINSLVNFVFTKDPSLLKNLHVWHLDEMLDMVFTISDVACRYALENPVMPYYLYRMENKNNLNNYEEGGMTLSFKSTSKSNSEVLVFQGNDEVGLTFDIDGFVPYIDVDKIVRTTVFSDEKEILFTPCVQGYFTGESEEHHNVKYAGVMLKDDFAGEELSDPEQTKALYESIKKDFQKELYEAGKTGEVSDNLKNYCSVVASYIYSNLRSMYHKYAQIYEQQHAQGFTK